MTSRERILTTLSHHEPDRAAIDLGATNATGISAVDTQTTLNRGTTDDVRRQVKEMLDIFSPGGGYVFSQVHNIEANVPAENVLAAFETAKNYRRS
jgi:uroporphyrinogen decarboxylase